MAPLSDQSAKLERPVRSAPQAPQRYFGYRHLHSVGKGIVPLTGCAASKDSPVRKLHLRPTPLDDSAHPTIGETTVLGLSFSLVLLGGLETPT